MGGAAAGVELSANLGEFRLEKVRAPAREGGARAGSEHALCLRIAGRSHARTRAGRPSLLQAALPPTLRTDPSHAPSYLGARPTRTNPLSLKVLSKDEAGKKVYLLGEVGGARAVLKLERAGWSDAAISGLLVPSTAVDKSFSNDVYSKYSAERGGVVADLTCPATDKHVSKATHHPMVLVEETAEGYAAVTRPFIEAIPPSRLQWVYNILEKKAEAERLIYEDADAEVGFVLMPDLKWDGADSNACYCLAIVHRHDVRSLRDLTAAHLPMLRGVLEKGRQAVKGKYGIPADKLRVFVHYQPSYYHFHVHFVHVEAHAGGQAIGKAHLLSDVITNLELCPGYYQRATLAYTLSEGDPLYNAWEAHRSAGGAEQQAALPRKD